MEIYLQFHRFNSSMVRLGVHTHLRQPPKAVVSIPAWCDWECCEKARKRRLTVFQFQHGAIGSMKRLSIATGLKVCFNSSMVRLGAASQFQAITCRLDVSIPAWCDWEFASLSLQIMSPKSFNSSMVRLGEKV